jgi:hypothetical protein
MSNAPAQLTTDRLAAGDEADVAEIRPVRRRARQRRNRLALFAVAAAITAAIFWPRDFAVRQTGREVFYLDLPFERVSQILVLTEATDDILTLGEIGDLKEYTWVERPGVTELFGMLASDVDLHARAAMKVQTVDEEYVGSHLISLQQNIDIRKEELTSAIELEIGTERLKDYVNHTRFSPDGKRTQVETSVTLDILVTAPPVARPYAARRVRASAERKVASQVQAIRDVIEANKDKSLISLPFGG